MSESAKNFDLVLNCTYSDLLDLKFVKRPPVLEFEIAELALIELPQKLKPYGFTVMCGQFFSTIPFPSTEFHSFSHVRYTPHVRWTSIERVDSTKVLQEYDKKSRFEHMVRDAQKFLPDLRQTKYVRSFFEVKTLLPQNASDDGRPIFFEMDRDHPNFVSIMGGKIDNVYDISDRIKEEFLDVSKSKKEIFASVIVPTRNGASGFESVIPRMCEILESEFTNFEIIIVDDASKDETENTRCNASSEIEGDTLSTTHA